VRRAVAIGSVLVALCVCWVGNAAAASPTGPVALLTDETFEPALRQAIAAAQEEVVVGLFLFKADGPPSNHARQMAELLGKTVARGVRVRVVLESSNRAADDVVQTNHHTGKLLRDLGVEVVFDDPQRRSHGKFVVVDRRIAFVGSHNWTDASLRLNHEVSVRVDDPALARELLAYAERLAQGDSRRGVPR